MKDLLHFFAGLGAIALVYIFYTNGPQIQSIVLLLMYSIGVISIIYTMKKEKKKQKDEDEQK